MCIWMLEYLSCRNLALAPREDKHHCRREDLTVEYHSGEGVAHRREGLTDIVVGIIRQRPKGDRTDLWHKLWCLLSTVICTTQASGRGAREGPKPIRGGSDLRCWTDYLRPETTASLTQAGMFSWHWQPIPKPIGPTLLVRSSVTDQRLPLVVPNPGAACHAEGAARHIVSHSVTQKVQWHRSCWHRLCHLQCIMV